MTGTEIVAEVRGKVGDDTAPYVVDDPAFIKWVNDGLEWLRHNAPECLLAADGRRIPFLRISALAATLCVPDPYRLPMVEGICADYHMRDGGDEGQRKRAAVHLAARDRWLTG